MRRPLPEIAFAAIAIVAALAASARCADAQDFCDLPRDRSQWMAFCGGAISYERIPFPADAHEAIGSDATSAPDGQQRIRYPLEWDGAEQRFRFDDKVFSETHEVHHFIMISGFER